MVGVKGDDLHNFNVCAVAHVHGLQGYKNFFLIMEIV